MALAGLISIITALATGASSFCLAVLTIWRGPKKKYIYFWAIICLGISLFTITMPASQFLVHNSEQALKIIRMSFIGVVIICMSFAPFAYSFLDQFKQKIGRMILIDLLGVFFLLVFLLSPHWLIKDLKSQIDFPYYPILGGVLAIVYLFWVLFSLSYALVILLKAFFKSVGLRRSQLKYIFFGLLLSVIGGISTFFPLFGFDSLPFILPMVFLLFFPVVITYGIVRHRLLEIRLIISRALGYFLVSAIFLLVYGLLVFASEALLKVTLGQRLWFISGFAIVLIAFLFEPLRRFVQKNLDRIFFRGRYEYPKVVLEAVEALVTKLKIENLLNSLASLVSTALGVLEVGVLLPSADGSYYHLAHGLGLDQPTIERFRLSADHHILTWLTAHNQIFIKEEQEKILSPKDFALLDRDLGVLSYALLAPLIFKKRLVGVLSLGDKVSRKSFSQQDVDLLVTISKQAAIALENAHLYQEIRKSEVALGTEKQRTDAVITSLTDGLIMLSLEGRVALVNPAAERMLDIHADLVLDKIPDPQMGTFYQVLMQKPEAGPFEIEIEGPPKRIIRASSAPVRDLGGKSLGMIRVLHDITRERLIDRMKSEFISIASHRLRTPLSAIKWSLSMFLQGDLGKVSQNQKDLLQKVFVTNEHMINLVNDLLNVARIEEGRIPYQYKKVQIVDLLREVINENQYNIKTAKLKLEVALPEKLPPKIIIDPDKIKMVFNVVLDNAIKYTLAGGQVNLSLEFNQKEIKVVVTDTGVGIPRDQQVNIFTKFFRGDNVVRMQTEGTGLGLFLSKTIIDRHGGRIWFESKENRGTKFFIGLPIKKGE